MLRRLGTGAVGDGLGINIHFTRGHYDDLRRIRAVGFRLVRMDLTWDSVEVQRGRYSWAAYDELMAELGELGLGALLILDYSNPLYARAVRNRLNPQLPGYAAPREGPARAAFMAFARAAAARYGRRAIFEIWNEPDLTFGDPVDLPAYVDFAMEACAAIRGVEPEAAVIGPASAGFRWPLLRDFLARDADGCFDGLSVHPYRERAPEDVLQDWARLDALVSQYASLPRRPVMVNSEWGYSSRGGEWTEQRQADYVVRLYLLNLMAGVSMSIIYDWQNDGPDPRDDLSNFGIIDHRGFEKPVYAALARTVAALRGLRYMGRVRTPSPTDFVLAFGSDEAVQALAGWTVSAPRSRIVLAGNSCIAPAWDALGREGCPAGARVARLDARLELSGTPVVIPVVAPLR